MADSMEMMILAILGPALHCDWHLSEWRQAFLTTAVFIGECNSLLSTCSHHTCLW
ncbi:Synaptic vesicle 2-related protein [Portunus trituberculatus]|uniref:Synaptic vesicle 2-related protein n=1 Tax=Portunus trituberculatus TaxID=210409 RepID=A0A5B7JFF9_PORTR|nr:Synaptic vesicle 2-related protein [Portunus trituberculatus]